MKPLSLILTYILWLHSSCFLLYLLFSLKQCCKNQKQKNKIWDFTTFYITTMVDACESHWKNKRKEKKWKEKSATESFSLYSIPSFGIHDYQYVLLNLKVLRCCMCLVLLLWRKPFFLFSFTLIGIELHFQYAFLSWYHIHSWMVLLTMSEPFIVDTCSSDSNTVVMVFGELSVLSHWQSSHCLVAPFEPINPLIPCM